MMPCYWIVIFLIINFFLAVIYVTWGENVFFFAPSSDKLVWKFSKKDFKWLD